MFVFTFLGCINGYGRPVIPSTNFFQKIIVRGNCEAFLTRKRRVRTYIPPFSTTFCPIMFSIRQICLIYGDD